MDEIERTVDDVVVLNRNVRYAGPISALMAKEHQTSLEEVFHSVLDKEAA
ncbi:hypothetical protein [Streptomyces huasconensis]